jgi:hypothetical protein
MQIALIPDTGCLAYQNALSLALPPLRLERRGKFGRWRRRLACDLDRNCGGGGCFLCLGSGQFAKALEALEEGFARSASFAIQDANCPDPRHRIFGWIRISVNDRHVCTTRDRHE